MKAKLFLVSIVFLLLSWTAPRASAQEHLRDWERAAGGHMEFEVASLKQNVSGSNGASENFDMGSSDRLAHPGGLFVVSNRPLSVLVIFAYKLSSPEAQVLLERLPKWAKTQHYDLEASAEDHPTKDQVRLMMQSLLAARFKLALHFEVQPMPVFALVLDKPGSFGPQLRPHLDNPPCENSDNVRPSYPFKTISDGFPELCGIVVPLVSPNVPGTSVRLPLMGGRDVTMAAIAGSFLTGLTGLDHPVVDETRLSGKFDFFLEWLPPSAPGQEPPPEVQDTPAFAQALKNQLGLKLKPTTAPVETIVLDYLEDLAEN